MIVPEDPLERVRTGMEVVDSAGRQLGRVARVQMAAPRLTHPPDSDLLDEMASVTPAPPDVSESAAGLGVVGASPVGHDPADLPDLPDAIRAHLVEVGFIELSADDLREAERFIAADRIESVDVERVVVVKR